jgi:hypothetical protein
MSFLRDSIDCFEVAESHFKDFANSFLKESIASRWVDLFAAASAKKWRKIDLWKLWDEDWRKSEGRFVELSISVDYIKDDRSLCPNPNVEAVVIALGHDRPAAFISKFSLLSAKDWPIEGLISLAPGKHVFATNHDGDVILCTNALY